MSNSHTRSRPHRNKGRAPWNKGLKGVQTAWNKGKKCPQTSGKKNGMFGKTHSKEARKKIGKAPRWNKGLTKQTDKRVKALSGKNSPKWKGGITSKNMKIRNSAEYKLWRLAVFERDKYACRFCGKVGGVLHADHIKPFALFPELRFAIDNGRTLCKNCHLKTETWGGRIHSGREPAHKIKCAVSADKTGG